MKDKLTELYECNVCKYVTFRRNNMITHKESKRHQNNVKNTFEISKYVCKLCNYRTNIISHYKRHLKCAKHIEKSKKENETRNNFSDNLSDVPMVELEYDNFEEENKQDKITDEKNEITTKEIKDGFCMMQGMFYELIKSNKQLINIVQNGTNNITNNINSNNTNTFNLNFFLNETCKDAINMKEFIESIEVSIMDLKKLGSKGYVEGISSLMIDKLNELDVTRRPIHSSDVKRETIYVKDDNVWEKNDKEKITEILWDITRLETRALEEKYKSEYPKCKTDRDSKEHEEYWRIFYNAMGGKAGDIDNLQKKVIKKVIQNIAIDKTKIY